MNPRHGSQKCLTCAVVKDWVGPANLCPSLGRAEKGSDILQRGSVSSAQRPAVGWGGLRAGVLCMVQLWLRQLLWLQPNKALSAKGGDDFTRVRLALYIGRRTLSSLWVWSYGQVHPGWSVLTGGFQLTSQSSESTWIYAAEVFCMSLLWYVGHIFLCWTQR